MNPITQLRKQYKLSQRGLVKKLIDVPGFSRSSIERWEGGYCECSPKKLAFIEKYLAENL